MTTPRTTTPHQQPHPTHHHNITPALLDSATPIDTLHPHPRNARTRDKHAEQALRESLDTNGQYRRVVARRLPRGKLQLLAGHGTSRRAGIVELDPRYADVICRRYQEHTGITPTREDGTPVSFTRKAVQ